MSLDDHIYDKNEIYERIINEAERGIWATRNGEISPAEMKRTMMQISKLMANSMLSVHHNDADFEVDGERYAFCPSCGQAIDWRKEE